MKRIFIVGIARSGTTLLQSIVGNHPDICTFPETHFFSNTIPKQKLLRLIHKITPNHQKVIETFFSDNNLGGFEPYMGGIRNLNEWTVYLVKLMDNIAESNDQSIWLEKTPMHLHFIDLIEKNSSNCYFLHMIREPKANIAALYDVSKKHPDAFKQTSLEKAINRYKEEISISQRYLGKKNHLHVHYEDVVLSPQATIKSIFEFLDISVTKNLMNFQNNVEKIARSEESWKSNNTTELRLKDKIKDRLTDLEIELLNRELSTYNPQVLNKYEG